MSRDQFNMRIDADTGAILYQWKKKGLNVSDKIKEAIDILKKQEDGKLLFFNTNQPFDPIEPKRPGQSDDIRATSRIWFHKSNRDDRRTAIELIQLFINLWEIDPAELHLP